MLGLLVFSLLFHSYVDDSGAIFKFEIPHIC